VRCSRAEVSKASAEVYHLIGGRYSINPLDVELGIWQTQYQSMDLTLLRLWDSEGSLLLNGYERTEQERQ
jgi:hypothetical protein